jgi:hypothetical protein
MPDVANFLPSRRGFTFGNSFPSQPDKLIPTPFGNIAIGDASNGLCGGMVFAVRDYFEAGIPQPTGRQPSFGQPLFDYIVDRLFGSFDLPNGPVKYFDWMTASDHDTLLRSGVARRTIVEEWPKVRDDLDNGRLSCLGLVTVASLNPGDLGQNHQVLAYGYTLGADDVLTVKVYDPNSPLQDDITVSLSLADPSHTTPVAHNVNIGHPIRGFFHLPYQSVQPPQLDDAEILTFVAPQSLPVGTQALVMLRMQNTGTTTWSPNGANPYRLGSQQPQDNTTWGVARVELPRDVPPGELVDVTFTVTAPAFGGVLPMGWRMVHELVQWFGELEERRITVVAPPQPVDRCDQLRGEILSTEAEIAELQAELQQAPTGQKAFLVSQIRARQQDLRQLRQAATTEGCPNIP